MILPVSVLEVQHEGGQKIIKTGNCRFASCTAHWRSSTPDSMHKDQPKPLSFSSKLSSPSLLRFFDFNETLSGYFIISTYRPFIFFNFIDFDIKASTLSLNSTASIATIAHHGQTDNVGNKTSQDDGEQR
jgi:hypothetical protein